MEINHSNFRDTEPVGAWVPIAQVTNGLPSPPVELNEAKRHSRFYLKWSNNFSIAFGVCRFPDIPFRDLLALDLDGPAVRHNTQPAPPKLCLTSFEPG